MSSPEDLTMLLERLDVQRAGAKSPSEIADAQVERLLARVAALTGALRAASQNDTARLASRVLLDDLALVAAQFRGNANDMRASLSSALDDLRGALEQIDSPRADSRGRT
jgi:DNA anti-recombination protein RmuC